MLHPWGIFDDQCNARIQFNAETNAENEKPNVDDDEPNADDEELNINGDKSVANAEDEESDLEAEAGVVPRPPGPPEGRQPGGGDHPLREILPETNNLNSLIQIFSQQIQLNFHVMVSYLREISQFPY